MITYEFGIRLKTSSVYPKVKDMEDAINESMAGFGFDEKMVTTYLQTGNMTSSKELTEDEVNKVTGIIMDNCIEKLGWGQLEYFRKIE